jgi:glutamate/tyrosine decarboxylase-like PLP-dependent enzyme
MNQQLVKDLKDRSKILRHTLRLSEDYFALQNSLPPGKTVSSITLDALPETGIGALQTLEVFESGYAHQLNNSAGPRYFGFVTGGSTPAAVAADWLVSAYDQNACGSYDSIAPQIEHQTIHYFRQFLGFSDDYFGSFVTGATMSNFVGLAVARQWIGEQCGIDTALDGAAALSVKVVSASPHASILKSLSMLGIGRRALEIIETLPNREAVDIGKLQAYLEKQQQPVIVVANAGTVNTGDFDDLAAIGDLKKKYNFWLHVDAAFGGFAACSSKFKHLMRGINSADSITVDAHKWMNVPYDAAMQFTRHKALQLKVFQNSAAYLGDPASSPDFFHYTPENSRRWRALPCWFAFLAYGKAGQREIVERNCSLANRLAELISTSSAFTLLNPVRLNVVCFTPNYAVTTFELIQKLLAAIREDGRVFYSPTIFKGRPAIRAAVSNWQTRQPDIEIAFQALTEIWEQLQNGLQLEKSTEH